MTMTARIVILNGAPRSGKSSIARALAELVPGRWVNVGVDAMNAVLPDALLPGIGLRPGGERPDLEPEVVRLYKALYDDIAARCRAGESVVVDVGHHDWYSTPLGILPASARQLAGLPVLFVGVHCSIEEIMARRNANPVHAFGRYATGEGVVPEPVLRWQEAVHVPGIYDLEVDTSGMTPEQCADAIIATLAAPPQPSAFERLVT